MSVVAANMRRIINEKGCQTSHIRTTPPSFAAG